MADIKVKNNANTTVVLKDVDTLLVPTSDGGTQMFRKWNGVTAPTISRSMCKHNVIRTLSVPTPKMQFEISLA